MEFLERLAGLSSVTAFQMLQHVDQRAACSRRLPATDCIFWSKQEGR
jgi:hypothetical protein